MLGAIVLSEFNEIVHTFGDPTFRRFAAAARKPFGTSTSISRASSSASAISSSSKSGTCGASSTTSGVASTSADSLLRGRRRRAAKFATKLPANNDEKYLIDHGGLLERVLPLVIIYRMSQEEQRGAAAAATRRDRSAGAALAKIFDTPADCEAKIEYDDEPLYGNDDGGKHSLLRVWLVVDSRQLRVCVANYARAFVVVFVADANCCSITVSLFQHTVTRCLDYHYGPIVQLLDAGYNSDALQKRAERRVERLAAAALGNHRPLPNDAFNVNYLYGNSESISELSDAFRELTARVSQSLSRKCRCLFVYCGQLIDAKCSDQRAPALLDAYDADAVASLLEFTLQDAATSAEPTTLADGMAADVMARRYLKCQVEQAWLSSRQLTGRRQYMNVHVLSLTDELELICLSNAHFAPAIDAIIEVLDHIGAAVEPLLTARVGDASPAADATIFQRYQTDSAHAISAGVERFAKAFVALGALKLPADIAKKTYAYGVPELDVQKYVYLANLERTQKLIKNQWTRLCEQITGYLQQVYKCRAAETEIGGRRPSTASFSYYYCSFPTSMRASLARLGSSLSLLSAANSAATAATESNAGVYTTMRSADATSDAVRSAAFRRNGFTSGIASSPPSSGRSVGAAHLNAMLTQLRGTLRGLLKELVECSSGLARAPQLHAVHAAVRQCVDKRLSAQLRILWVNVVAAWRDGSPLRPLRLGLDPLAYRVARNDIPFSYHFIPNEYRSIFCRMAITVLESDFFIARSENGDLLVQVTKCDETASVASTRTRIRLSGGKASSIKSAERTTTCTAVFPACVNVTLALRQTYQLIAAFDVQIDEAASRIK